MDFAGATWGDDLVRVGKEDESLPAQQSQQELPASYETEPDAMGMRLSVSFRWAGQGGDRHVEKVTKYIKTVTKTTRVSKAAEERRNWTRFGAAASTTDDSNVTIKVHDPVPLEIAGQVTQDADIQAKIMKTLKAGQQENAFKQQFERLMGDGGDGADGAGTAAGGGYSELARQGIADMQQKLGGGRVGVSMDDDQVAIRISNLSKDATQDDVRELVSPFGRVARCTVPKNKFGESRGFAYVNFYSDRDAQACIDALDGHGYDYLILEVKRAEARGSDPGRSSMRHVTGYGKALPQTA